MQDFVHQPYHPRKTEHEIRLKDPRFIVGALLYISGFITLVYHDYLRPCLNLNPQTALNPINPKPLNP